MSYKFELQSKVEYGKVIARRTVETGVPGKITVTIQYLVGNWIFGNKWIDEDVLDECEAMFKAKR